MKSLTTVTWLTMICSCVVLAQEHESIGRKYKYNFYYDLSLDRTYEDVKGLRSTLKDFLLKLEPSSDAYFIFDRELNLISNEPTDFPPEKPTAGGISSLSTDLSKPFQKILKHDEEDIEVIISDFVNEPNRNCNTEECYKDGNQVFQKYLDENKLNLNKKKIVLIRVDADQTKHPCASNIAGSLNNVCLIAIKGLNIKTFSNEITLMINKYIELLEVNQSTGDGASLILKVKGEIFKTQPQFSVDIINKDEVEKVEAIVIKDVQQSDTYLLQVKLKKQLGADEQIKIRLKGKSKEEFITQESNLQNVVTENFKLNMTKYKMKVGKDSNWGVQVSDQEQAGNVKYHICALVNKNGVLERGDETIADIETNKLDEWVVSDTIKDEKAKLYLYPEVNGRIFPFIEARNSTNYDNFALSILSYSLALLVSILITAAIQFCYSVFGKSTVFEGERMKQLTDNIIYSVIKITPPIITFSSVEYQFSVTTAKIVWMLAISLFCGACVGFIVHFVAKVTMSKWFKNRNWEKIKNKKDLPLSIANSNTKTGYVIYGMTLTLTTFIICFIIY